MNRRATDKSNFKAHAPVIERILITGGAGFIGSHVAAAYAKSGMHVTGIGRGTFADRAKFGIAEWHPCEVTLENLRIHAGQPHVIVHCAGGGSVGYSNSNPYQDFQKTVATTAAVLEFVRLHSAGTRVVYPSSGAVYGAVLALPIAETAPTKPFSPYAAHKLMAEELCASYARNFGVATSIVRLFSVYGPGLRKQLLWDACQKIAAGKHEYFGTGNETRDWLHVDDAVTLLQEAARHADATCPIVNGGTGEAAKVSDVLRALYHELGQEGAPSFNGMARSGDPAHFQAETSKARSWGWRPAVSWRDGISEYAAWYRTGAR